jgi:hypothetical protein
LPKLLYSPSSSELVSSEPAFPLLPLLELHFHFPSYELPAALAVLRDPVAAGHRAAEFQVHRHCGKYGLGVDDGSFDIFCQEVWKFGSLLGGWVLKVENYLYSSFVVLDRYFETIRKPEPPSPHELFSYIFALICLACVNLFAQY